MLFSLALTHALAGTPVNGDFELPGGWTDASPGASTVQRVVQGTAFGDTLDTTGLVFPSPTHAMLLKNGPFDQFTPAIVSSDPLLVTHTTLTVQHFDEIPGLTVAARFRPTDATAVVLSTLTASPGAFTEASVDLSGFCGVEGRVQFAANGSVTGDTPFTLLDDVAVVDLCAEYLDTDDDGFCPLGIDLDDDGTCAADGEAFPAGTPGGDCADDDPTRFPGAFDLPFDGVDQDCSGADFQPNCFADLDADGFGSEPIEGSLGCTGAGESTVDTDCDDTRADAFPGAPELCNGLDDDCDDTVDPDPLVLIWPDRDDDGAGDRDATPVDVCGPVVQGALTGDDCDDTNPFIGPSEVELPADGVDQDCDDAELCWEDTDGDDYGAALAAGPLDCAGFVLLGGDCDDANPQVSPAGIERCNNLDDDCDGEIDEGYGATLYLPDADGDGFGDDAAPPVSSCASDAPEGLVETPGDCDDSDAAVHPEATEVRADGVDQDCDGFEACYTDLDGDGYGALGVQFDPALTCAAPPFADDALDCDDADAAVNPDATEVVGNAIDEDCDGVVDPGVQPPLPAITYGGGACQTGFPGRLPFLVRRR
jgi:hypothetical protein